MYGLNKVKLEKALKIKSMILNSVVRLIKKGILV